MPPCRCAGRGADTDRAGYSAARGPNARSGGGAWAGGDEAPGRGGTGACWVHAVASQEAETVPGGGPPLAGGEGGPFPEALRAKRTVGMGLSALAGVMGLPGEGIWATDAARRGVGRGTADARGWGGAGEGSRPLGWEASLRSAPGTLPPATLRGAAVVGRAGAVRAAWATAYC